MTDSEKVPERLKPEDFAIFGGFTVKDGQPAEVWILGPQAITDFLMEIDNVDITITELGSLNIAPKVNKNGIGGFLCSANLWKRTADLNLVPL